MQYTKDLSTVGLETIAAMADDVNGIIDHIYLHWTAGRYGQVYPDYHISIDFDGRIYLPGNCKDLSQYRIHTWKRNSRAVAVALCGCYDASANAGYNCNFGSEGVTNAQIEAMALVVATLCKHLDLPLSNVLTHCEAALEDGYGPYSGDVDTRWDLWYLPDSAQNGKMISGGDVIRGKAQWYLSH